MRTFFILSAFITICSFQKTDPWSEKLRTKVDATIKSTYELEDYHLNEVSINEDQQINTKSVITHNLFTVSAEDAKVGFVYVSEAPSKDHLFDYIVLFDEKFKLVNTKVLIYREQHGRQIGTKRWLSQFVGMTPADRPILGGNIDGISGATISVTNMTNAIHDLLESIDFLIAQNFFND